MAMKMGSWAFMIAFFGAIIVAVLGNFNVWAANDWVWWILIIAGLIVGFINVMREEALLYMVAVLSLTAVTGIIAGLPAVGGLLESILASIAVVAGAAVAPVALKAIYDAAK